jgi:hypothetical protein
MYFEFQLSSDVLCRIIRNQIHQVDLGMTETFTLFGGSMVDHIEVETTTTLERRARSFSVQIGDTTSTINGQGAVIVQPLKLALVKIADLVTNGSAPTTPFLSVEISFVVRVDATASGGSVQLQYAFDSIDFGPVVGAFLTDAQKQDITNNVQSKFSPIARTIDTSSIQANMPDVPIQITNAGAVATSDGAAFILRVEIGGGDLATWTDFYNTYDRNLLSGRDWAMLMDKDLLIPGIQKSLQDKLAGGSDQFALESDIDVAWRPDKGPDFEVSFSGEVIDACSCFFVDIDVDVDISCSLLFQAPGSDTLRMHITTDYDTNDLEVFCCALTSALFWPVVGIVYLAEGKTNFGQYLLGWVITPIGTFIATCVIAGDQSMADQMTKSGTCTKVDDKTVDCDQSFTLNMGTLGGSYHLTAVDAQPEGPVFSGTTTGIQSLLDPSLSIGAVEEFQWGLGGGCDVGFSPLQTGAIVYSNAIMGSILKLTEVSILDDPQGAYANVQADNNVIVITPNLNAAYLAAPYACKVRIVSNGGIRIITLDPAQPMTVQQAHDLELEAVKAKANCYLAISPLPWAIGKYIWLPDPPPERDFTQIWQVVVSELAKKDTVELLGDKQAVLATATPGVQGIAQASLWAEGSAVRKELDVRVTVGAEAGRAASKAKQVKRHVALRQVQLVERSRIATQGELQTLRIERRRGSPVLTIRSAGAIAAFDLRYPASPSKVPTAAALEEGLVSVSGLQIVQRSGSVALRDRAGTVLRELKVADDAALTLVANRLYVAEPHGVTMLQLWEEIDQTTLHGLQLGKGARLWPTRVLGVAHAIAVVDGKGRVRVYDVSDPKDVREIAHYPSAPWFLYAHRCGRLLARLAADGKTVVVYEVQRVARI